MIGIYIMCFFLSMIIYYITEIKIFTFLSDIRLVLWEKLFIISTALFFSQVDFLTPLLIDPVLFFSILKLKSKQLPYLQTLFLAFFPSVFIDLFSRFLLIILFPSLVIVKEFEMQALLLNILAFVLIYPCFALVNYFIGKDYRLIFITSGTIRAKNFYKIFLIFILAYYVDIFLILGFDDPFLHYQSFQNNDLAYQVLFFIFTFLFLFLLSYFNHKSKHFLELEIKKEQEDYIENLESYGKHLEQLYREMKIFQEDYSRRLQTLEAAIDNETTEKIQETYYHILNQSSEFWDDKHYNISKLAPIKISSVKSLLSAKIVEAEKKGIETLIEVPDQIIEVPIPELDLLLILSVFLDNAIEAALKSEKPRMTIAYFLNGNEQRLHIANSTKEASISISRLFKEGYSTKGDKRGIGLSNVQTILGKHPHLSLQTKSQDYEFSQMLTILAKGKS
ncbi:sensor histidine kinase [Streptococcus iniae]|uniref:GHKL domain-containing protein n=1 Tax=Streptococcus iniae TaxID=1346 RepID=A0A3L8GB36_STRIN|nr:GHKL domain-containing protein [Streptococcus iniae]AGM99709.1 Putative histidine kinase [Streptococcus iniae SF1]AHY16620.1 histidine kinase [Streptococcus iniae]AHY18486.1 histidine kinase [Streptococcus iniae]AJG26751.1 histidine kinase [Streptococcus iniae]APD32646.1 histidine kinase [Streptococcus iniae]